MLDRTRIDYLELPAGAPPRLLVVVDTEEEFDWAKPHARANTSVAAMAAQGRAQEIFARYGVVPTYVVDYPVATSDMARDILAGFLGAGQCEIGAHLHPWVNPPHEEAVTPYTSYHGNLPAALERAKLETLGAAIRDAFGVRPTVFRAGRWGLGPATAGILEDLGYQVDTSIVPYTDFSADGGPDFRAFGPRPAWFGRARRLLEIPQTAGFAGLLAGAGPAAFPVLAGSLGMRLRAPGVAARLGLLERIRLTPEGVDLAALKRLTRSLLGQGVRIFTLTYHSPTLQPGGTPYVRDGADLRAFLGALEGYLAYFMTELGGRAGSPGGLYREFGGSARAGGAPVSRCIDSVTGPRPADRPEPRQTAETR